MPAERIAEKETESLANLEKNLKGEVYGQDEAIESIVDKVLVNQAGLKADDKPIGSFVFMGPTGTGKTETAKQLAKCLGVNLVRFDMSEYQEKHSVSKLIGSPPGYVGYEENNGLLITNTSFVTRLKNWHIFHDLPFFRDLKVSAMVVNIVEKF